MLEVSRDDIQARIERDNPWWAQGAAFDSPVRLYPKRLYFSEFSALAIDTDIRRAVVLMGPRRVGKTVMLLQLVDTIIEKGFDPKNIMYTSIDAPIFTKLPLESFLTFFPSNPQKNRAQTFFVLFDEVQYLKDWEIHLKDLVDSFPNVKFIASGSAAAALRLKSQESGAGRFSDFPLPPLTFAEYLEFVGKSSRLVRENKVLVSGTERTRYTSDNIEELNREFIDYLNFGGYPESALSEKIRSNADQFVRNDIIDKVLLKDLPALYGIQNIQELNSLFSHLAYNTGQELSLQSISSNSGVTKPTIQKYIEYLESAFLLARVSRVDRNASKFKKEMTFKVYLTNPSMRAALFSPVSEDNNELIGHLAESAIFAQWYHGPSIKNLYYARWPKGEIDIVNLAGSDFRPVWAVEIKWSDSVLKDTRKRLAGLYDFVDRGLIHSALFTTKTQTGEIEYGSHRIEYMPCSLYCYTVGKNVTRRGIARRALLE